MSTLAIDPAVDWTLRAALALLLVGAAAAKMRDLARFRASVGDYRLVPDALVAPAAVAIVAAELALGALLLVPGGRAVGLAGSAALLLVYAAAVGVNLARGRRIDCGCGGPGSRRPIGGRLVARNVIVAAVALAGLAPVRVRPALWLDGMTVAAATAALAALWAALDRLGAQAPALAALRRRA
jgi:hypothetical protein